jgi:hypothetical protein
VVEGRARPAWSPEFRKQILKELTIESDDSKEVVKLTFFRGASLPDPEKVCNPVSRGTRAEPSTFAKARSSTRPPSSIDPVRGGREPRGSVPTRIGDEVVRAPATPLAHD